MPAFPDKAVLKRTQRCRYKNQSVIILLRQHCTRVSHDGTFAQSDKPDCASSFAVSCSRLIYFTPASAIEVKWSFLALSPKQSRFLTLLMIYVRDPAHTHALQHAAPARSANTTALGRAAWHGPVPPWC